MTSDEILTEAPMQTVVVDDLAAEPYVVTDGTVVVSLSGRDIRIELRMRSETARGMADGITQAMAIAEEVQNESDASKATAILDEQPLREEPS